MAPDAFVAHLGQLFATSQAAGTVFINTKRGAWGAHCARRAGGQERAGARAVGGLARVI